jgi:hypothetical protein
MFVLADAGRLSDTGTDIFRGLNEDVELHEELHLSAYEFDVAGMGLLNMVGLPGVSNRCQDSHHH